ncbi:primosomal protein N' (replication factor Y) [Rhodoligotrophos appendicifer]|uniref:primosomal protein N' n=1 Tax=Rhodoligotrophos appendicifer TaxID=987056 RepID=UPI00118029AE|nr:primosomal protein N' [Rhodoligotrophos appendicifer]
MQVDTAENEVESAAGQLRVEVLLPLALSSAYSYLVPSGMELQPGDYVRVPLGPRDMIGVIWSGPALATNEPGGPRLRAVRERYDAPPMAEVHRRFVDWVAAYNLVPAGMVLRMCLRSPAALGDPRMQTGYRYVGLPPQRMTPQRQRVIDVASNGLLWRSNELAEEAGVTSAVIRGLVASGTLVPEPFPADRDFGVPQAQAHRGLSKEQAAAAKILRATVAERAFSVTVLDGVTGAGKTEVYCEAVAATIAAGRQVLILLPEIALTSEFIRRLEERFAAEPAEWHSALKSTERERVWRGIASGDAKIVIGARSALFLPFRNLGLIVVDEEHESAFKQEEGVTYHARDMAVVYGSLGQFPVILSSATPSLESLANVDRGRYRYVALTARHGAALLPSVDLMDMRSAALERGRWMSEPLVAEVVKTLGDGEQVLLFLNRRGYAPVTLCRVCGHRMQCPNCDSWLVEHRFRRRLLCHHCGHDEPVPEACPSCGTENSLVPCGPGVERLAEEVAERFPTARIALLSSDLLRGFGLRDVIRAIAERRFDIIIGTQLVAKGHHFPGLTLVGVVDADLALSTADPRAAERTYQLLTQVAGRAGREALPGRAIIQTYMPDHPLMKALKEGDRDGFLAKEKQIRQGGGLPPYGRLAALIVSGRDQIETERFAKDLARLIPTAQGARVYGPSPAPMALVRSRYRFRFLVEAGRDFNIQAFLATWLAPVKPRGSLRVDVDIDPYSFL